MVEVFLLYVCLLTTLVKGSWHGRSVFEANIIETMVCCSMKLPKCVLAEVSMCFVRH